MSLVGRALAGRYDVLALLGEGGMGAVYRARDRELDEVVALKVIRADLASDPAIVERFRSEVKLARRVTHANVARTFELGNADGVLFCTMELVDGEPLAARLRRAHKLPIAEAVAIAAELCDALAAAHAVDVVHRDVKPDNILLARDGRVVVADFGVAAMRAPVRQGLSGTPAYMAPEQARGEPPTPATDVYAVGVVLFEMIAGRRAFSGDVTEILADKLAFERVRGAPGELPPELAEVVGRATAQDPLARHASAAELRRAFAPWDTGARRVTQTPARGVPVAGAAAISAVAGDEPAATTVSAIAPGGEGDKLYLAEAVYDEVVERIARLPRVRVRPRPDPSADLVVAFHCGDDLAVELSRGDQIVSRIHVPLAIRRIDHAADGIADAVASAIALGEMSPSDPATEEASDLMYRARHLAMRDASAARDAMAMLERAIAHAPDDPRIAARVAISLVRLAFFTGDSDPALFARSSAMARGALAQAPGLVAAHLALGHIELNVGEAATAAGHFRRAIACAPHSFEAHEQLGAMLLEAGYLGPALARLEDAIAINPGVRAARWEIARAWALEGRWADHERMIADMLAQGSDRIVARVRFAWWRRDTAKLQSLRAEASAMQRAFLGVQTHELVAAFVDGPAAWPAHLVRLRAVLDGLAPNRRRRALIGQFITEAAGYHGDVPAALAQIARAIDDGLFDLHWLDKCPVLDGVRAAPGFAPLRARIKQRADAILDALYGDHQIATSETVAAG